MTTGKIVGCREYYRIEDLIATGAFSTVYRCVEQSTGCSYAIKTIDKKVVESYHMTEALIQEVNSMEVARNCPFVINLVDKLVSQHNYYIIMDLADGGTLLELIRERRHSTSQKWVGPYFKQLLIGLVSLHERNVVHRDIKPENILLNKNKTRLMISDFGFACYAPEGTKLHRGCGTLKYCAPELLRETLSYDGRKADVWAAGVTFFLMLFRVYPFHCESRDPDELLRTLNKASLTFPKSSFPEAEELLSHMLELDPVKRWSVADLLQHPWMQKMSLHHSDEDGASTFFEPFEGSPLGIGDSTVSPIPKNPRVEMKVVSSSWDSYNTIDDGFYHSSSFMNGRKLASIDDGTTETGDISDVFDVGQGDGVNASLFSTGLQSSVDGGVRQLFCTALAERQTHQENLELQGLHWRILHLVKMLLDYALFFCFLSFAVTLRVLLGWDIEKWKLPRFMHHLVVHLLTPPFERPAPRERSGSETDLQGYSRGLGACRKMKIHPYAQLLCSHLRRYVQKVDKFLLSISNSLSTPHHPKPFSEDVSHTTQEEICKTGHSQFATLRLRANSLPHQRQHMELSSWMPFHNDPVRTFKRYHSQSFTDLCAVSNTREVAAITSSSEDKLLQPGRKDRNNSDACNIRMSEECKDVPVFSPTVPLDSWKSPHLRNEVFLKNKSSKLLRRE